MSAKLENWSDIKELALMSIGTNKGTWWADTNFGSDLWLLRKSGKVDGTTAGALRRMILECLQWLVDDGLAAKIECEAERSGKNQISYCVIIYRDKGRMNKIKEVWNAV